MQCSCGGNAKLNASETHHVCEDCGRASKDPRGPQDLFALMNEKQHPRDTEHYRSLQPLITKLRKQAKWCVAHESEIIHHLIAKGH